MLSIATKDQTRNSNPISHIWSPQVTEDKPLCIGGELSKVRVSRPCNVRSVSLVPESDADKV
jgi:hypothetical protein